MKIVKPYNAEPRASYLVVHQNMGSEFGFNLQIAVVHYVKSVDILEDSDNISDTVKALNDSKSFNGAVNIVKGWR